jgi:hypothetical protein
METKVCTTCNEVRDSVLFGENRAKCKLCRKEEHLSAQRTKEGVVSRIYRTQKTNSKVRGHRAPEYTKQELQEWLFSQKLFHELHSEWKESGYLKRLKPSVDRKQDGIHYCMNNIQLMTWQANEAKAHEDSKTHKLSTGRSKRAIRQLTLGGVFVAEFISGGEVIRQTGFKSTSDALRCRTGHNRAYGFLWEYV